MAGRTKNDGMGVVGDNDPPSVFGLPPYFNATTDPFNRIWARTFGADGMIVTIQPGVPRFNSLAAVGPLTGTDADGKPTEKTLAQLAAEITNPQGDPGEQARLVADVLSRDYSAGAQTSEAPIDMRYYVFENSFALYRQHLSALMTTLGAQLFPPRDPRMLNHILLESQIKPTRGFALQFYAEKVTGSNENISNEFGESMVAGLGKGVGGAAKELSFLMGRGAGSNDKAMNDMLSGNADKISEALAAQSSALGSALSGGDWATTILGRAFTQASAVTTGANQVFPEIWKDSRYGRQLSLRFKLISPYGDLESIWKNVYVPFLSLLALAAPRQVDVNYGPPFVMKIDCPGFFSSDLCAITNISWTKGGDDDGWSFAGLPLAIDVTVDFKDLYGVLMVPPQPAFFIQNVTTALMLQNMAGIRLDYPNLRNEAVAAVLGNRYLSVLYQGGGRIQANVGDLNASIGSLLNPMNVYRRFFK